MKVLFMFAAALALASACDGDEGDTYAEMYTETGECGETHYEDTCGAWVDLNDNDVLEEELGACKVAQTNYEGVSPPNSPEVLATVGCDSDAQLPTARFYWVEPNNNGAEVDRYEVTVWKADGDMVRSWPAAPASQYEQPDGSYEIVVAGLAPGEYTARIKALNSAGQSADGISVAAVVPEPVPPAVPTVTAWGAPGEVHVKAVVPNYDDVCNAPSHFEIRAYHKDHSGRWARVPELAVKTTAVEYYFVTVDLNATADATAEIARAHKVGRLVNGQRYQFSVVASSTHGIAAPSAVAEVVARGQPRTPKLQGCGKNPATAAFGCHVIDNCTASMRFGWDSIKARGPATDSVSYSVRAFVDGSAVAATELKALASTSLSLPKMSWAIGKFVRFQVRSTVSFTDEVSGRATAYDSAWSSLTAAVPIPGPTKTPALTAKVDTTSREDRVVLSWSNAKLDWIQGMPDMQRFKVIVRGTKGESQATICAVRNADQCKRGMQWPSYCLNTPCSESLTWAAKPAIQYDQWDTRGLSFFVTAEGNHHSGCSVHQRAGPSGIKLLGPPAPPAAVTLSRPSMREQVGGVLHVAFAQASARNGVRVEQYRIQLYSDLDHNTPVQTKLLNAPVDASAEMEHTFSDLDNTLAYFVTVAAKNWRDYGTAVRSKMSTPRPSDYVTVKGASLEFEGVTAAQYRADESVQKKLKHAIAAGLTRTCEGTGTEVSPEMVVITKITDKKDANAGRRLIGSSLVVEFDVDIPFTGSSSALPTGITDGYDRLDALRAADDLMLSLLNRRSTFVDALGADLAESNFPYRAPLLLTSDISRGEHTSTFTDGFALAQGKDQGTGVSGDRYRTGGSTNSIAGMSSYAFVLLVCGVGVLVLGSFFAIMARRRTMSGLNATPAPGGLAGGAHGAASTQWKRASIKAAHAGGGGTETSFFESDIGATDEATPASFSNPSGAGAAADAARRQALRKSSHQFMKHSTKQSLRQSGRGRGSGLMAGHSVSSNPMTSAASSGSSALPDDDVRGARTLSVVDAERGSV